MNTLNTCTNREWWWYLYIYIYWWRSSWMIPYVNVPFGMWVQEKSLQYYFCTWASWCRQAPRIGTTLKWWEKVVSICICFLSIWCRSGGPRTDWWVTVAMLGEEKIRRASIPKRSWEITHFSPSFCLEAQHNWQLDRCTILAMYFAVW